MDDLIEELNKMLDECDENMQAEGRTSAIVYLGGIMAGIRMARAKAQHLSIQQSDQPAEIE